MKKTEKKKQKTPPAVYFLGAACAVALIVLVVVAIAPWQKQAETTFTPPPFEKNAVQGVPTVDESLGWSELAVREGYTIKVCGVLQADADGKLPVWLYSDPGNTVWVKLRILDAGGNRIGETGLLKPGEYVETVQLAESAQAGNVTLHVMGYEPETYYSGGAVDFQTTLTVGR